MNPPALFALALYTIVVIAFCAWLLWKTFRKPKVPVCTLAEIRDEYIKQGYPKDFYVPDAWFNHIVSSIYTAPGSNLPKIPGMDDQGYFLRYEDSKLRPECTRPK